MLWTSRVREGVCRLDNRPATEQLTIWGSVDVWQSARVKKVRLPAKLTTLRQKLYRKAKLADAYVCPLVKSTGKPDAGNPHVRFDEGEG